MTIRGNCRTAPTSSALKKLTAQQEPQRPRPLPAPRPRRDRAWNPVRATACGPVVTGAGGHANKAARDGYLPGAAPAILARDRPSQAAQAPLRGHQSAGSPVRKTSASTTRQPPPGRDGGELSWRHTPLALGRDARVIGAVTSPSLDLNRGLGQGGAESLSGGGVWLWSVRSFRGRPGLSGCSALGSRT
jgi:hypothetical protein